MVMPKLYPLLLMVRGINFIFLSEVVWLLQVTRLEKCNLEEHQLKYYFYITSYKFSYS